MEKQNEDKNQCKFMIFDKKDFYPSIKDKLLTEPLSIPQNT